MFPGYDREVLSERVLEAIGASDDQSLAPRRALDETDVILITYADTLLDPSEPPLRVLTRFARERLDGAVSIVHLLPFFPSSGDGGFSVIDPHLVDSRLGSWADVEELGQSFDLMSDLVINHLSAESPRFLEFIRDEAPGRDWFFTADPQTDLSAVVRPRTHALLRPVATPAGVRHVWCTFGHDQPDVDVSNPEVLLEWLRVVDRHLRVGTRMLRLDAVAYVWKRPGSSCLHLPETHELVRLLRLLVGLRARGTLLVTETNVPHMENISYFGEGDEAQVVYNFSLAPLLVSAALSGDVEPLRRWLSGLAPPPDGCTLLNFLASHDGLGVRPATGLLDERQQQALVDACHAAGGEVSNYSTPEGPRPYELNVSLFDLMAVGLPQGATGVQMDRFVAIHAVMLALAGVPALYVHSLLGSRNDHAAAEREGSPRAINRSRLDVGEVERQLRDPRSPTSIVLGGLTALAQLRRRQPAFHPMAAQEVLSTPTGTLGLRRTAPGGGQTLVACTNLSSRVRKVGWADLGLGAGRWFDVFSDADVERCSEFELAPYQTMWLTDRY